MQKAGTRGAIINVASTAAASGDGPAHYCASKAALNMLIKTASLEYARKSPNTIFALLHPGTTDTHLSQPFQRGVPPERLFPVSRTVAQLMTVIDNLEPTDSGEFFSWDGSRLPW
jgi:NAD(P)-dependent dehydrogenase (short-subunit alcohol dehydrogenase family)